MSNLASSCSCQTKEEKREREKSYSCCSSIQYRRRKTRTYAFGDPQSVHFLRREGPRVQRIVHQYCEESHEHFFIVTKDFHGLFATSAKHAFTSCDPLRAHRTTKNERLAQLVSVELPQSVCLAFRVCCSRERDRQRERERERERLVRCPLEVYVHSP